MAHYTEVMSDEDVTKYWGMVCDVMPLDTKFSSSEAARRLVASGDFASFKTAIQYVSIALIRVHRQGSPDLKKVGTGTGARWMLPGTNIGKELA